MEALYKFNQEELGKLKAWGRGQGLAQTAKNKGKSHTELVITSPKETKIDLIIP